MVYVANKCLLMCATQYIPVYSQLNTQYFSRCKLVFSYIQTIQHTIKLLISHHFHKWYRRCSYHDDMGFFHYSSDREGCHNCCSYHKHGDVHVNCMHLLLQQLMMLQKTASKIVNTFFTSLNDCFNINFSPFLVKLIEIQGCLFVDSNLFSMVNEL